MSDLISRQAAIENSFEVYTKEYGWCEVVGVDAISELPSAQSTMGQQNGGDTISRQAAIDLLKQMRKDGDMIPWEGKDVFARIRKLPSAQTEIVKCKKCRYVYYDKDFDNYWCNRMSGSFKVEADDFCSRAERRTDECID